MEPKFDGHRQGQPYLVFKVRDDAPLSLVRQSLDPTINAMSGAVFGGVYFLDADVDGVTLVVVEILSAG